MLLGAYSREHGINISLEISDVQRVLRPHLSKFMIYRVISLNVLFLLLGKYFARRLHTTKKMFRGTFKTLPNI